MKLDRVIAVRNCKTVYRNGDKCIKVFNRDFSKADILNEALNQARIEEAGLLIPRLSEVSVIEGKWAIVTEYIKGKTLDRLIEESPDELDRHLEALASVQVRMHSKTCPGLTELKKKMHERIALSPFSAAVRLSLFQTLDSMPENDKICHGDFTPSNVIIAENGWAYIIDWSHATRGSGAADAALTYLSLYLRNSKDTAEKYLSLYCKKSGTAAGYVRGWIAPVAAAQYVKANEKERKFLLSQISITDTKKF